MAFSILEMIRSKRREKTLSVKEQYQQLLSEVASGAEIDADRAADILDRAGKTESDFEHDCLLIAKRSQAQKVLDIATQAAKRIPMIENQIARLVEELDAVCKPISLRIRALTSEMHEAEDASLRAISARNTLEECNRSLPMKSNDVQAELTALRRRESDILSRFPLPNRGRALRLEIDRRQTTLSQMREGHSLKSHEYEQRQIDDAQWGLDQIDATVASLETELDQVRNEIRDSETELRNER